jgi:uncharacterized phage protein gp47/JayE
MATAFENKTIAEIRELLLNAFQEKFNKVFRLLPKSFIKVMCIVFSGVYITLYKMVGWLFLQIFPDTAYWGEVNILGLRIRPLIKWGVHMGVGDPFSGSPWRGTIRVVVLHPGGPLAAGTQLKSDITGKLYITEEGIYLENETEIIPVVCAENGTSGNLDCGDTVSFVNPIGTVEKSAAITDVTAYAKDDETEDAYRCISQKSSKAVLPPLTTALPLR